MDNWQPPTLPLPSMRIAFYINDPVTNGEAAIALSWVRQLAMQYPEDRHLVLSEHPLSAWDESFALPQVTIAYLPPRYRFFPFWADALLFKKLHSFRPDLVVSTHPAQRAYSRCKQVRVTAQAGLAFGGTETFFTPVASDAYSLLSTDEKHAIKEQWSLGREFFMLAGTLPSELQLTLLLQAFSIFKHRQQSGLRLVLPFSLSDHYPALAKKIDHYKYRSALVITGAIAPKQVAQLAGSAYALVAPSPPGSATLAMLQSWQIGVPLLVFPDSGLSTLANESVLFASEPTKEALAVIMMQIYKDESLRLQLIRNGQHYWSTIDTAAAITRLRTTFQQLTIGPPAPTA